jgi:IS30 family transposase
LTAGNIPLIVVISLSFNEIYSIHWALDNGPEFTQHKNIRKRSLLDVFYANPYCSWERGLNENTNGLIRQYYPKRSKFDHITKEDIKGVQEALNQRPRKTLNYYSPIEVFI